MTEHMLSVNLCHVLAKREREKQLMTGIPFSENVTRLWELLSTTLQRANAFAIKKRYYETLPNTDEVPRVPPHSVYYISPLMTEYMLSVYLCHVLAK